MQIHYMNALYTLAGTDDITVGKFYATFLIQDTSGGLNCSKVTQRNGSDTGAQD